MVSFGLFLLKSGVFGYFFRLKNGDVVFKNAKFGKWFPRVRRNLATLARALALVNCRLKRTNFRKAANRTRGVGNCVARRRRPGRLGGAGWGGSIKASEGEVTGLASTIESYLCTHDTDDRAIISRLPNNMNKMQKALSSVACYLTLIFFSFVTGNFMNFMNVKT